MPVVAGIAVNAIVFGLKWNDQNSNPSRSKLLPPGWAIGAIWVVLLGFLGFAHFKAHAVDPKVSAWLIVLLVLACLAYPFYKNQTASAIGDTATTFGAYVVAIALALRAPVALPYIVPLLVWGSYVVMTTVVSR